MSTWYEPKLKDLHLTDDGSEIHAYIFSDESGAVYTSVSVEDIKRLLKDKHYIK